MKFLFLIPFIIIFNVAEITPETTNSITVKEEPEYWIIEYTQNAEWAAIEVYNNNHLVEVATSTKGTGLYIIPKSSVRLSGKFDFANVLITFSKNGIIYKGLVNL